MRVSTYTTWSFLWGLSGKQAAHIPLLWEWLPDGLYPFGCIQPAKNTKAIIPTSLVSKGWHFLNGESGQGSAKGHFPRWTPSCPLKGEGIRVSILMRHTPPQTDPSRRTLKTAFFPTHKASSPPPKTRRLRTHNQRCHQVDKTTGAHKQSGQTEGNVWRQCTYTCSSSAHCLYALYGRV